MSNVNFRVVPAPANAVTPMVVEPFPQGANSVYSAGQITAQNNTNRLAILTGQNGGIKTRKRIKRRKLSGRKLSGRKLSGRKLSGRKLSGRKLSGGANPPVVVVSGAPSYAPSGTDNINLQIAGLAIATNNNAVFDKTGTGGNVNAIAAQQNRVYYGTKGGSKRTHRSKRCKSKRR